MTEFKAPSPEALAVAHCLFPCLAANHAANAELALALDAHRDAGIAAALRERTVVPEQALRAELEATQAELAITGQALDEAHDRVEGVCAANRELRAELKAAKAEEARQHERGVIERRAARLKVAELERELESLRKPLEGELAEALETVRRFVGFSSSEWHAKLLPCLARIEAALRAKGEPLDEKRKGHERLSEQVRATLSEFDRQQAQAAEPPEPRPIVVGSKWRSKVYGDREVSATNVHGIGHVKVDGVCGTWGDNFRDEWEWLSGPEPATPAASLKGVPVIIDDSDPPAAPAPDSKGKL
jgi:molecular chaperone GrpE (heat shock protein)